MHRRILLVLVVIFSGILPVNAGNVSSLTTTSPKIGGLRRQAYLGVDLRPPTPAKAGALVTRIIDSALAAKMGLRLNDRILRLNGTLLDGPLSFERIYRSLRAGDTVRFCILRENQVLETAPTLLPLPLEQLAGVDVIYDSVLTDGGYHLRTILTRPKNVSGKLPAVFLVGWLSCDSVEYPMGTAGDGFGQLLHDVAMQSGFVQARVDKPGIGDSEGPACVDTDFQTELAGYRAAFNALKGYEFIDPDRIFLLGLSNVAGFAPLVTQNEKVRGYIVAGGWAKTWFEHMIELERRRLKLSGKTPDEISDALRGYAEFYDDYLIQKMTPREVIRLKPHLAPLWYDLPEHQYGRPAAFYQQLEELNLAAVWRKVEAPVLAMHGEYDWIMSREDHELITELVNLTRPGHATFVELPRTSHLLYTYESAEKAFMGDPAGQYNNSVTDLILKFLRDHR